MMIAALVAMVTLIIGGLNWALVGIFDWNLLTAIFGMAVFTRILYVIIGLAALYMIYYIIMQSINAKREKSKKVTTKKTTSHQS